MAVTLEFLEKFKKDPESVLQGRLLPPPTKPKKTTARLTGFNMGLGCNQGLGSGGGAKSRYTSPEALSFVVDEYFMRCQNSEGAQKPTIAGLALALGFTTKKTLDNYREKSDAFRDVIDTAYTRMEDWKNQMLLRGGQMTEAAKFDLKNNHGWADKSDTTVTHVPGGSLAELVHALQGRVLRPTLFQEDEPVEEGEFEEIAEDAEESEPTLTELEGRKIKEEKEIAREWTKDTEWLKEFYEQHLANDSLDYDI